MSEPFFTEIEAITHEGPDSENPLAYRFYDAERPVRGESMREQLRFANFGRHVLVGSNLHKQKREISLLPNLSPVRDHRREEITVFTRPARV